MIVVVLSVALLIVGIVAVVHWLRAQQLRLQLIASEGRISRLQAELELVRYDLLAAERDKVLAQQQRVRSQIEQDKRTRKST